MGERGEATKVKHAKVGATTSAAALSFLFWVFCGY